MPNQLTESDLAVDQQLACRRGTRSSRRNSGRLGRLTLQGALRFDRASSWFPEQQEGPSRFLPTAISFPETKGVDSYKDITPRMGVAYDVFGNGKTALKVNVGKYLEGVGVQLNYVNSNPTLRLPRSTGQFRNRGRDADLDRREREFRARLRSAEPARQRSTRQRRRLLRRRSRI